MDTKLSNAAVESNHNYKIWPMAGMTDRSGNSKWRTYHRHSNKELYKLRIETSREFTKEHILQKKHAVKITTYAAALI